MKTNDHSISLNGGKVYGLWTIKWLSGKSKKKKKGDLAAAIHDECGNYY
jgi:hypothetical protein